MEWIRPHSVPQFDPHESLSFDFLSDHAGILFAGEVNVNKKKT
ncbi:hypothetical protein [Peribacillus simplex]|uniref:Uncharacterized protein n=1 Tax=Peribacillus simplex TaxID=1478 RepID=A0AAW7IGA9_9BACI|nr:hypothetical protein [Peribacillus simplex]MDM5454141.1 hypothetical protein [Peribacillus simplex]